MLTQCNFDKIIIVKLTYVFVLTSCKRPQLLTVRVIGKTVKMD